MFCFAIHVYTDQFADMGIIVIRPPWVRCEFLADCRSCSFSGHKKRCWTVLSELRCKIAYNPNTFFLNSKHIQQEKPLRMHCSTSKCMQQEFEPKLPRAIIKMSRKKSFDFRVRFGAIYSASKTKKYLLKNSTIGNRLLFSELANTESTCPENSNSWLLLPDRNLFLKF